LDLHVGLSEEKDQILPAYDEIKDLPYLRACIDESMRLRAVLPLGLPRVVPPEGMLVDGQWIEGNTTVSVSTYTIHRDSEYFSNPDEYRPERWLEPGAAVLQKVFMAFQQGGRACLGRNIAYLELQMIIATLVRRYEFVLPTPDWELKTWETIMGHTGELPVKISKRV
jgi:cytochrome P450